LSGRIQNSSTFKQKGRAPSRTGVHQRFLATCFRSMQRRLVPQSKPMCGRNHQGKENIILETAIDRLLPALRYCTCEHFCLYDIHQMGEHATYLIAHFSSRPALLLLNHIGSHAASSRLAERLEKRTLGHVQSPFLGLSKASSRRQLGGANVLRIGYEITSRFILRPPGALLRCPSLM
jgi:hypothetical protein